MIGVSFALDVSDDDGGVEVLSRHGARHVEAVDEVSPEADGAQEVLHEGSAGKTRAAATGENLGLDFFALEGGNLLGAVGGEEKLLDL